MEKKLYGDGKNKVVYNNINEIRGVQESLDKFHQNKKVLCKQMAKYINDKRVY